MLAPTKNSAHLMSTQGRFVMSQAQPQERQIAFRADQDAGVLELEQVEMMPISMAFEGCVECNGWVSGTCLISVARNRLSD